MLISKSKFFVFVDGGHKWNLKFFPTRVSASNAICAPLTWQQGDLRRPYPTDIEMRLGFLGKSDLSLNGHNLQHQISATEHRNTGGSTSYFPSLHFTFSNNISLQMFPLQLRTNLLGIRAANCICQWELAPVQLLWTLGTYCSDCLIHFDKANRNVVFSERTRMIGKTMSK